MKKERWLRELDEPAVGVPRGWSFNKAAKSSVPALAAIGFMVKLSLTFRAFHDSIRVAASLAGYKPLMYARALNPYPPCDPHPQYQHQTQLQPQPSPQLYPQSISQSGNPSDGQSVHLNPHPYPHHGLFCL